MGPAGQRTDRSNVADSNDKDFVFPYALEDVIEYLKKNKEREGGV